MIRFLRMQAPTDAAAARYKNVLTMCETYKDTPGNEVIETSALNPQGPEREDYNESSTILHDMLPTLTTGRPRLLVGNGIKKDGYITLSRLRENYGGCQGE